LRRPAGPVRALNGRLVVVKRQKGVTEGEVGDTGYPATHPQMAEPVLERALWGEVSLTSLVNEANVASSNGGVSRNMAIKPAVVLGAVVISLGMMLSSCSSTMTMAGSGSDRASALMFPLTEQQADRILATAMTSEFAGSPISRVEFPNKGYQATIRFALDSHSIVAYMISANGVTPAGETVSGYYFEVSNSGTMPLSGGTRARNLYERLIRDASVLAPPIGQSR
jgi:hypothetical protein